MASYITRGRIDLPLTTNGLEASDGCPTEAMVEETGPYMHNTTIEAVWSEA